MKQQPLGESVDIVLKFDQAEITGRVELGDMTFGSCGAAPCLIVFAIGTKQDKKVAIEAHLDQAILIKPEVIVKEMLETLDTDSQYICLVEK